METGSFGFRSITNQLGPIANPGVPNFCTKVEEGRKVIILPGHHHVTYTNEMDFIWNTASC